MFFHFIQIGLFIQNNKLPLSAGNIRIELSAFRWRVALYLGYVTFSKLTIFQDAYMARSKLNNCLRIGPYNVTRRFYIYPWRIPLSWGGTEQRQHPDQIEDT